MADIASQPAENPPALGVIELSTIVRGYKVVDAMVKRSPVQVRDAYPVSSGKFLIFVGGEVAEVEEAMDAGVEAAGARLCGELFLPYCHPDLWLGLGGEAPSDPIDALALFESESVTDVLLGADKALKTCEVGLCTLRLAKGIGGRAFYVLAGEQYDVEAALEATLELVSPERVVDSEIILVPHSDMTLQLLGLDTIHPKY